MIRNRIFGFPIVRQKLVIESRLKDTGTHFKSRLSYVAKDNPDGFAAERPQLHFVQQ